MKLKIVMDSGKEYITDKYESKEDFLKKGNAHSSEYVKLSSHR